MNNCVMCLGILKQHQYKYCSNKCQLENQYRAYIEKWKQGLVTGSRGIQAKNLSGHVIRYILEKYDYACSQCGWNEINEVTGKSPLEIDHIDGNSENNTEQNLRVLCPNCHSLTFNYKNLNYGNGRQWRREKYVKIIETPL